MLYQLSRILVLPDRRNASMQKVTTSYGVKMGYRTFPVRTKYPLTPKRTFSRPVLCFDLSRDLKGITALELI